MSLAKKVSLEDRVKTRRQQLLKELAHPKHMFTSRAPTKWEQGYLAALDWVIGGADLTKKEVGIRD